MQNYYFSIAVNYDFCERFYEPGINTVIIEDEKGKRVRLPVLNLRPYVTPDGIKGRFRLVVDNNNKIQSFERMA